MIGPQRARLRVPDQRDILVLAGGPEGPVIAEVGLHDRTRQLNVRAGRYFIRQRLDTHLLEGTMTLAAGDDRLLQDQDLARVEYIRVAAKGAHARERHDAIEAGLLMRTPLTSGGELCGGMIAGYVFDLTWVSMTPRVAACRERARNDFVSSATDDFTADLRMAHAWHLGPLSLTGQVQLGAAVLHQRFDTDGVAPSRMTGAAYFGAGARIGVTLGGGLHASVASEVNSFVLQRGDAMTSRWESTLSIGAVIAVGVER
jgi:hypothetical protein